MYTLVYHLFIMLAAVIKLLPIDMKLPLPELLSLTADYGVYVCTHKLCIKTNHWHLKKFILFFLFFTFIFYFFMNTILVISVTYWICFLVP